MNKKEILELIDFVIGYSVAATSFDKPIPNAEELLNQFIKINKSC